ncbi:MAG: group II intron maturase-specific domain-containing protein [Nostoc sp.]
MRLSQTYSSMKVCAILKVKHHSRLNSLIPLFEGLYKKPQIREWLKNHLDVSPEVLINKLNPIIRGWGNYYRYGVSKQVFSFFDDQIWRMLYKWALRRHGKRRKKWVLGKYFRRLSGGWKFFALTQDRRSKPKSIYITELSKIPIQRHVKVKGSASPDDPTLHEYWHSRGTRHGKTRWIKGSKLYLIAEQQNWLCPICNEHLFNGEEIDTHHILSVKDGGTDNINNLVHLHKVCHQATHYCRRVALLVSLGYFISAIARMALYTRFCRRKRFLQNFFHSKFFQDSLALLLCLIML